MFVLIDGLTLQTPSARRGIGRYSRNLIQALRAARPNWRMELVEHAYLPPVAPDDLPGMVRRTFPGLGDRPELRWANQQYFGDWLVAQQADRLVFPSPIEQTERSFGMPAFRGPRPPVAAVLYDLIPALFPVRYEVTEPWGEGYIGQFQAMTTADTLMAISQASADDAARVFGAVCPRVVNIRGAADDRTAPLPPDRRADAVRRAADKFGLGGPYILYVGGGCPRKNMFGAISGYAALPEAVRREHRLVFACHATDSEKAAYRAHAAAAGVEDRLTVTGYVSDEDLVALYAGCRVLFFPSHYEGLGLPVIEAMRHGAPAVVGDNSSLPEYGGDVSWYCDATSPVSMAAALQSALAEPYEQRLAERLAFADSFTWADTAERAAQAIASAARQTTDTIRRKRVAWVSPCPPVKSGISDYAVDVARTLVGRYDLEWVYDARGQSPDPTLWPEFRFLRSNEVDARHTARPFDLFIYHIGNSEFHTHMLPLMDRWPGVVVQHDFRITGLERMAREHGNLGWDVPQLTHQHLFERAAAVAVHSYSAWREVRRLTPRAFVLPMHVPDPELPSRAHLRERFGFRSDQFVVTSLGMIASPKRNLSLVEAVAGLPPALRDRTRLVLVGEWDPGYRQELDAAAARLGVSERVEYVGFVPLAHLSAYALAADVVVQLRYPCNGETSAALVRALMAGGACVCSDIGSMSELPDQVVVKVRGPAHEVSDVRQALIRLSDPTERERLASAGRGYALATAAAEPVAARYSALIELAVVHRAGADADWLDRARYALSRAADLPVTDALRQWVCTRRAAIAAAAPAVRADMTTDAA
jgi:glycosyltransferase involved in cell wall biosynthesis